MQLENLVVDALDPQQLGRHWEAEVGGAQLTDAPGIYETRSSDGEDGPWLDLCFQQVPDAASEPSRLHVVLGDGAGERSDPEGNPYVGTGPLTALRLESADPARDAAFWAWLTGWTRTGESLRHPSGLGPVLELVPERGRKTVKNRRHLDVRLEPGEDADEVSAAITARGGQEPDPQWGEQPWRTYLDPSGNEFCVLPVSSGD